MISRKRNEGIQTSIFFFTFVIGSVKKKKKMSVLRTFSSEYFFLNLGKKIITDITYSLLCFKLFNVQIQVLSKKFDATVFLCCFLSKNKIVVPSQFKLKTLIHQIYIFSHNYYVFYETKFSIKRSGYTRILYTLTELCMLRNLENYDYRPFQAHCNL